MTDDVKLLTCSMGRKQGGQQVAVAVYSVLTQGTYCFILQVKVGSNLCLYFLKLWLVHNDCDVFSSNGSRRILVTATLKMTIICKLHRKQAEVLCLDCTTAVQTYLSLVGCCMPFGPVLQYFVQELFALPAMDMLVAWMLQSAGMR